MLRISKLTDYGTLVLACLAGTPESRLTATEVAERSMQTSLEQFELADQLGFDWVTLAEHHFAPMSLTPNPEDILDVLVRKK